MVDPESSRESATSKALAQANALLFQANRRRQTLLAASVAGVFVAAAWTLFSVKLGAAIWPALILGIAAIALSAGAARAAAALRKHRRRHESLERSLARQSGSWVGSGDWGEGLEDANHPYAKDLDLFGEGSLFELLAPPYASVLARSTLAEWLLRPGAPRIALARQEAIAELSQLEDVQFQLAEVAESSSPPSATGESLREWTRSAVQAESWRRVGLVCSSALLLGLAAWILAQPYVAPGVWLGLAVIAAAQAAMCWQVRESVERTVSAAAADLRTLREMERGARLLEGETFVSPLLRSLQQSLIARARSPASRALRSLNLRISWLQARNSDVLILLSIALAWATQWSLSIEAWRLSHGAELADWMDALGAFEALCVFAAFAADHPRSVYPSFLETSAPHFDAEQLQNPLIATSRAVGNPVRLGEGRRVLALTGSNMSGKSTYLRAIGLNYALARAGAPVRASRLELSDFELVASARPEESVHLRQSRFQAEALKLGSALQTARNGKPVLLLADEILNGTNSHDRRIGARAVVEQTVKLGGSAVVTTHDVSLAEELAGIQNAQTAHFRDHVEGGKLEFDYQLRPGIVQSSNALVLLRAMQVDV